MKRYLKYLPLLITLLLIIFFNLQSKEDSMKLSNYVASLFKDNIFIYTHIRKLAHTFEYFILGISTYLVFKKKSLYLNILISLLDQTFKYLLPIRHFDITDISYDFYGYILAYLICITIFDLDECKYILKRILDILGGIVGSLITILLTLIIGPIIKLKSPGPIFYKQERIGLNGRHFYMYKFRSMVIDADKHLEELKKNNRVSSDLMFKMENDPRIIPGIGNFIRKSSLDEFPQFFNALKGDMSLVGTRPPTVDEWNKYELRHRIRMSTKPGITGMWQVSGRNNITDFDEVVRLDAKYIAEWTIGLDIKLIVLTVLKLFKKDSTEVM